MATQIIYNIFCCGRPIACIRVLAYYSASLVVIESIRAVHLTHVMSHGDPSPAHELVYEIVEHLRVGQRKRYI